MYVIPSQLIDSQIVSSSNAFIPNSFTESSPVIAASGSLYGLKGVFSVNPGQTYPTSSSQNSSYFIDLMLCCVPKNHTPGDPMPPSSCPNYNFTFGTSTNGKWSSSVKNYTDPVSGYFVTLKGFLMSTASCGTNQCVITNTPPATLYEHNSSMTKTGVGIAFVSLDPRTRSSNEIGNRAFIQLNLTNLFSNDVTSLKLYLSSLLSPL